VVRICSFDVFIVAALALVAREQLTLGTAVGVLAVTNAVLMLAWSQ
jgi:hypothetical protein